MPSEQPSREARALAELADAAELHDMAFRPRSLASAKAIAPLLEELALLGVWLRRSVDIIAPELALMSYHEQRRNGQVETEMEDAARRGIQRARSGHHVLPLAVTLDGWMQYQACKHGREVTKKGWRRCWFRLERNALSLYKAQPDNDMPEAVQPVGVINTSMAYKIAVGRKASMGIEAMLSLQMDDVVHHMYVDDAAGMHSWIAAISAAARSGAASPCATQLSLDGDSSYGLGSDALSRAHGGTSSSHARNASARPVASVAGGPPADGRPGHGALASAHNGGPPIFVGGRKLKPKYQQLLVHAGLIQQVASAEELPADLVQSMLSGSLKAEVAPRNTTVNIFLCGTLADMHMERAAIHDELQSFLRPLCEQLRLELRIVDPYEGLGSGNFHLNPQLARHAASEAEMCIRSSAATAVVGLVGDTYENSPLPEEILEEEWTQMRAFLIKALSASESRAAIALMDRWYVDGGSDKESRVTRDREPPYSLCLFGCSFSRGSLGRWWR